MKRTIPLIALLLAAASVPALPPAHDRIVVLISVDGLAHYYFDDPKAEMPTIRQLAAEGARAKRVKCSMPTVTWPNHTTLVTGVNPGRHGVIGNSYLDRDTGKVVPLIPDPLFNKEDLVKTPTVYDVAKAAGMKTAAIIWPASRGAKTLDWTVPDVFTDELFQTYGTPSLLREFKEAHIPYEKQGEWCKAKGGGEDRDRMYVQMLNHVIRTHRPNLALLHLVELDHVEHNSGPQTPEAYKAVKFDDDRVREVWNQLLDTYPGRATLVVAADHGFFPYQQQIQPNVLLRKHNLLTMKGTNIGTAQVRAVAQGGACFVYVLDTEERNNLIPRLTSLFQDVDGVDEVIGPKEFAKYGMADPQKDRRMADLVLSAKSGYTFTDTAVGDIVVTNKMTSVKGNHGYDPNQPGMHATFVAWGVGIKAGSVVDDIDNTDVAPTVASLLNLQMPEPDGKVLQPILTE